MIKWVLWMAEDADDEDLVDVRQVNVNLVEPVVVHLQDAVELDIVVKSI